MAKMVWHWRYLAALLITLAALVMIYVVLARTIFVLDGDQFARFVEQLGWTGPLVVIGLIALEVIIAPLPGGWLSIATGYLFGSVVGFFYAYIGNALGSFLAFELARTFGQPFIRHLVSAEKYRHYQQTIHRSSVGLALLYAIPLFPIDVVSLLLGVTGLTRRRFLLVMLLGFIPNMALLNFFGGAIAIPEYRYVMLLLVALGLGYFIVRAINDYLTPTTPPHSRDRSR